MLNFFKNLFGISLKAKVMKAVNKKLDAMQKAYDSEVAQLVAGKKMALKRAKQEYLESVSSTKFAHNAKKSEVADKHVDSILSKIL